jgi:hypothetical protein
VLLVAAHVRSNHVHVVVQADEAAEDSRDRRRWVAAAVRDIFGQLPSYHATVAELPDGVGPREAWYRLATRCVVSCAGACLFD